MYKRIKRESNEKNTQISLKNILEKVNKSLHYRCFLCATGLDLKFFESLSKNHNVKIIWHGNLKKGFLGFLLKFIPSHIGIIEFLKPIDEDYFENILYDCGPSLTTIVIMSNENKIPNFISSFQNNSSLENFESSILEDENALIYVIGVSDIDDGINYEEIVFTQDAWLDILNNKPHD